MLLKQTVYACCVAIGNLSEMKIYLALQAQCLVLLGEKELSDKEIHDRDMDWLEECDGNILTS